jgi:3-deoxy-D-manno-octulosonic-acid transferase
LFNHLKQLTQQQIPFVFISTHFFKNHFLLKSWNRWLLAQVLHAYAIFVQDDSSKKVLQSLGYDHAIVTGDTRSTG